jgi:uridylate kinase
MCGQKIVLLKITGEFLNSEADVINTSSIRDIARQIRELKASHYFGIVIGGGNFFRGAQEGLALGLSPNMSDQVGMLATIMNGAIIQDLFKQEGLDAQLFSALECPSVASSLSPQEISFALRTRDCIIFAGGLGNPFFTTDTTAVVRGLQIGADEIWKATKVDGVYTQDPKIHATAQRIDTITYTEALAKNLTIMDESAFSIARKHKIGIKIFSLFTPQALVRAAHEPSFGSTIVP